MTELAVTVRPLTVIEAELDLLERDTRQKETALIENYIEVGRRLEEVKAQLAHGEWGPWLEKRGYPQAKAVKLMKISQAYGKDQQSLFGGEAKSQAFGNLGFHKLVQLLAIEDEEDREKFVAEHDVEAMSTRELEKTLREREKALEEAAAAKAEADGLRREMGEQKRVYEENVTSAQAEAALSKQDAKHWQEIWENTSQDLEAAKKAAAAAEAEHTRLLRELEELRSRPIDVAVEVDTEAVEAARKAAIDEMTEKVDEAYAAREQACAAMEQAQKECKAAEEALAAVQKELVELKAKGPRELTPEELQSMTADAVEKARAEDRKRVQSLEKQLATADGDIAAFKVHFDAWQKSYQSMMGCLKRTGGKDPEKAGRMWNAVKSCVEGMGKE